jgi:hypothetical protein
MSYGSACASAPRRLSRFTRRALDFLILGAFEHAYKLIEPRREIGYLAF